MRATTLARMLLGIMRVRVTGLSFDNRGLRVEVRPAWWRPRCGKCGRRAPAYDKMDPRLWRHLAIGRMRIWLSYTPRRVHCPKCGVRAEQVPWAAHGSRFTLDFEEMAAYLAQRMDKTAVCRLMGIDWRTVGTIVARVVRDRLDPARLDELYVIGVDEISYRRHHKYLTVVVDHARHRVVWTGEGKNKEALGQFFDELGPERSKKITHAVIDMSASYQAVIEERAAQAQIVFDRFHVQQLASNAVDKVRREQVRELRGTEAEEAQAIKESRWALLKNPWDLTRREGEKLRDIQNHNRSLYRAYLLKESLAKTLDYLQPARASDALKDWLRWASRSKLAPFVKLARTIREHAQRILAYIPTRLTNGITEGLNNKIRLITRRAFGFHSPNPLMAMIHLCCGGITLEAPLPGTHT